MPANRGAQTAGGTSVQQAFGLARLGVVLVRGEIVESGTHDELLARGAEYRKLYELQFRDVEALEGGTEAGGERVPARKAAR